MECACDLPALAVLLLALGAAWSANPSCPDKALVTCDAGTFFNAEKCACEVCPDGTFSSLTGVRPPTCNLCRSCSATLRIYRMLNLLLTGVFQDKVPCSRTRDVQCECKTGFRCIGNDCSACHSNCEGGEEPSEKGCRKCQPETFNNETNGLCKPWTKCDIKGLHVLLMGNSTTDTLCVSPAVVAVAGEATITYPVMIAVSVFLFACVVCPAMILVAWVKKKVKDGFKQDPLQIVTKLEPEDACSYHLPEEEQGDSTTHMLTEP